MELPKQFDNITSHVIDDLKVTLRQGSKVSMAAASFSIYAFEALQKELELPRQRLIKKKQRSRNGNFIFPS